VTRPFPANDWSKLPPRKGFYDAKEELPDYQPNYEFVQKRICSAVPRIDLCLGRKPMEKKPATKSESLYDYDRYTKQQTSWVFPKYLSLTRTFYTNINKMLPKELDPSSGLPSFMQTRRPVTAHS
jgi:hypothetical protein